VPVQWDSEVEKWDTIRLYMHPTLKIDMVMRMTFSFTADLAISINVEITSYFLDVNKVSKGGSAQTEMASLTRSVEQQSWIGRWATKWRIKLGRFSEDRCCLDEAPWLI
jgi:hypothetical protein